MNQLQAKKIALIGIGNSLCGDDGAGAYLCQLLEINKIDNLHILTTTQLDTTLLEELKEMEIVILADASLIHNSIKIERLDIHLGNPSSSSHHIHPVLFAELAHRLFSKKTTFYTCAIPGESFELGQPLSDNCKTAVEEATSMVLDFIKKIR